MQRVVQRFGDLEELRIAVQDQPLRVHVGAAGVGEQHLEHLGDTATRCGRVDVPDDPPGERLARQSRRGQERFRADGVEQPRQLLERLGLDLDGVHGPHPHTPGFTCRAFPAHSSGWGGRAGTAP
jgi:hypothetical protein